jgi:hypothetical protein
MNIRGLPAWTHCSPCFHWGVPSFLFESEPFFGQDRIDLPIRRMQDKGADPPQDLDAKS